MDHVDVRDLPEPFARAVEAMVQTLRQQLQVAETPRQKVKLASRAGTVIGSLSRDEIYEDVG